MRAHVTTEEPVSLDPVKPLLGHCLSPMAMRFAKEYADFLARVDFKDMADHPLEFIRSCEGHCSSDGERHTIWLDTKNEYFEALMMHHALAGVLTERGFPRTMHAGGLTSDFRVPYLAALLSSAVMDPVIDGWLARSGYAVYDRDMLTQRAVEQVWLDTRLKNPKTYGFRFCKWTLVTVLIRLDLTFDGEMVNLLHALIRKKFPEPWALAERLSAFILQKGFAQPHSALIAMLQLRAALKLEGKITIVDGEGTRY